MVSGSSPLLSPISAPTLGGANDAEDCCLSVTQRPIPGTEPFYCGDSGVHCGAVLVRPLSECGVCHGHGLHGREAVTPGYGQSMCRLRGTVPDRVSGEHSLLADAGDAVK